MKIPFAFVAIALVGCSAGYKITPTSVSLTGWNEGRGHYEWLIAGADPATFEVITGTYAKDRHHVYHEGNPIETADPDTFRPIRGQYWKDKAHVFLGEWMLRGADPATFRVLETSQEWGLDANDVYFGTTPIHVEDLGSFRVLRTHWAKDL